MTDEEKQMSPDEIKTKAVDYVASGTKALVGAAPFVGGLLSELAGNLIPNQRMDRIMQFAVCLEKRIGEMEATLMRESFKDEEFTELLEESMHQAVRATSVERKEYLASVIANSLSNDAIEHIESRHLLKLLGELNDLEIIWLRFYAKPTIGGDEEFREKHKDVLESKQAYIGCSTEELDKHALQESYRDHLHEKGLLDRQISTDMNTDQPEFDRFTNDWKVSYYQTSPLGKLLLRTIGIDIPT